MRQTHSAAPLRVAAYCRVSTDKEDQLHSLAAQRQFFLSYLAEHPHWSSAGIYADEGLSGTSVSRRPQFAAMIGRAMAGEIDLILTREVSRFARNTVDTLQLTRQLKARGVGVCFLSDGIDTRDNDGEFRLTIMASVAQEESRKISQRTRWGQLQAMKRGVVFGNDSIYGYRLTGGALTLLPSQAEVVRRIFQAFLIEGKGAHTIARELTEAAVPPPRRPCGPWSAAAVLRVLHNEKYTGDLLQHKYHTTDHLSHRKIRAHHPEDSFWLRDHHPAIVSRETFEAVQQELARRAGLNKAGRRHSARHWYSGRLSCGLCGRPLAAKQTRRKNGRLYLRFVCRGRLEGSGCTAPALSGSALRAAVRAVLSLLGLGPAALARALGDEPSEASRPLPAPAELSELIEQELLEGEFLLDEVIQGITVWEGGLLLQLRQFPVQFLVRVRPAARGLSPQAAVIGCFPVSGGGQSPGGLPNGVCNVV